VVTPNVLIEEMDGRNCHFGCSQTGNSIAMRTERMKSDRGAEGFRGNLFGYTGKLEPYIKDSQPEESATLGAGQ